MDETELRFTLATALKRLINDREVSQVEIIEAVLRRIERLNPRLNAFIAHALFYSCANSLQICGRRLDRFRMRLRQTSRAAELCAPHIGQASLALNSLLSNDAPESITRAP